MSQAPDINESSESNEASRLLDALPTMERAFVISVLKGESLEDSAKNAGWRTEIGLTMALARPRVREALEQLAPLALEPKAASKVLGRYWLARLVSTASKGSDAQALGAVKELSSLAGYSVSKSEVLHASIGDVVKALDARNPPKRKQLPAAEVVDSEASEVLSTDTESGSGPAQRLGKRLPAHRLKR